MVTFDSTLAGTAAATWRGDTRWAALPTIDLASISSLVVLAAHPDDESLGAGGVIAACARRGVPVEIVIVTDGAASHPNDESIAERRATEARAAIDVLAPNARVRLLGFPDGETLEHRDAITAAIAEVLLAAPSGSTVLAPWRGDGHRDHRVIADIAAAVVGELAEPARLWEYPIWMWHWGSPEHPAIEWGRMRSVPIDPQPKWMALAAYTSQTEGPDRVLSVSMLEHFESSHEIFFVDQRVASDSIAHYLERTYARRDDPWRVESRWYEQRKRAVTLASLPAERYGRALEVGCSIGVLTSELASRSDELLAVDLSMAAVQRAQARLAPLDHVEVQQLDVRSAFPAGEFDLIVLSEVGYYLTVAELTRLARSVRAALGDEGTLIACHWRHAADAHVLSGDDVHAALDAQGIPRLVHHVEADFVLDVYSLDRRSVAQREGIV